MLELTVAVLVFAVLSNLSFIIEKKTVDKSKLLFYHDLCCIAVIIIAATALFGLRCLQVNG